VVVVGALEVVEVAVVEEVAEFVVIIVGVMEQRHCS
jgi:hypothetical protein